LFKGAVLLSIIVEHSKSFYVCTADHPLKDEIKSVISNFTQMWETSTHEAVHK